MILRNGLMTNIPVNEIITPLRLTQTKRHSFQRENDKTLKYKKLSKNLQIVV